ncbi:hypothetical protein [Arenicella xantha]|uniref:Uncharacterized protein n=1 Tax=Arenicella xantha TaxID=644221 RepID=A0A395JLM8_9GAMM|nr:hypothetical protein [Arenicella xantha]RBP51693.1 hypothetical protein DFR28_1021125 [Arenicella xantha]
MLSIFRVGVVTFGAMRAFNLISGGVISKIQSSGKSFFEGLNDRLPIGDTSTPYPLRPTIYAEPMAELSPQELVSRGFLGGDWVAFSSMGASTYSMRSGYLYNTKTGQGYDVHHKKLYGDDYFGNGSSPNTIKTVRARVLHLDRIGKITGAVGTNYAVVDMIADPSLQHSANLGASAIGYTGPVGASFSGAWTGGSLIYDNNQIEILDAIEHSQRPGIRDFSAFISPKDC